MKIALGQTIGTPGDVRANLQLMRRLAREAATQGAALLLLPELFLSGYNIGDAVPGLAEPSEGPSAIAAGAIAAEAGLAILYGYPERAAGAVYNSALLLDRTGRPVANYRKTHLWGEFERAQFQPGTATCLFDFAGARFGLMICYDIDFPELARRYALGGADAILAISATTAPYSVVPRKLIPARAYENQLFMLFCDRTGGEHGLDYAGESGVAAPDGEILAACSREEALLIAELDFERYRQSRAGWRFADDRRPELYSG
ncbi:MAG TPA: carbon-nitrogen hydrolase family protein [Hypericibacter adhaerens]|jgi:predicted amidohydrolase|uniref:Hydrolase n=1 Tax=Hypericibacter adhaerens TaxID=2602016 RepID=A0A5J6MXR6_9PROT|nr:carbon-nitrogen hydrolase family protein [Hypericibacter adhaerens]QEX21984.1 hydrolase [Hypericibacter adhaerens]HWA45053.1 carbon-nitrogen hydrolase family protein [Hypericibacter adhaerens]